MTNHDHDAPKDVDSVTGIETTGHEWDGIKELNNPAPRWWLWVFGVCVIYAIGYWYIYPAWPTLSGHTAGAEHWSEYNQLKDQLTDLQTLRSKYESRFTDANLQDIQQDPELYNYAVAGGATAFKNNCAGCHGAGAQGGKGFPNLNDDVWLWGGSLDQIYQSIRYGAHNENPNSHQGAMPAWKDTLQPNEIEQVATYVEHLHEGDKAEKTEAFTKGAEIFAANCAVCHGENGEGKQDIGAPPLRSGIWLYGGDHDTIVHTLNYGRQGVMPVWEGRLPPNTIKQLAVYVHSLGGGQ